jgi:hypothetical protein
LKNGWGAITDFFNTNIIEPTGTAVGNAITWVDDNVI